MSRKRKFIYLALVSAVLFASASVSHAIWWHGVVRNAKPMTFIFTDGTQQTVSGEEWVNQSTIRFHAPLWIKGQMYASVAVGLVAILYVTRRTSLKDDKTS